MLSPFSTRLLAVAVMPLVLVAAPSAQERAPWDRGDQYGDPPPPARSRAPDPYRAEAPPYSASRQPAPGGFGQQPNSQGQYGQSQGQYGQSQGQYGQGGYEQGGNAQPGYGQVQPYYPPASQSRQNGPSRANDAYRPGGPAGGYANSRPTDANRPDRSYEPSQGGAAPGYGSPYEPPQAQGRGYAEPYDPNYGPPGAGRHNDQRRWDERTSDGTYSRSEVAETGHRFFGSISSGLASAIESIFQSAGRPNGYILGEDAGGAFIAGLRYGEGTLYTKNAGNHRVFWQGPSLGYDFGAEGSKTMVLVYNLRDPAEIYERFGGVQGSAYLVGGVSVQFQKHGDVVLAPVRSGVGLRLGANVGYLKYTRTPTWNPF